MDLLKKYIVGLVHLYGVVTVEEISRIYKMHNNENAPVQVLKKWLEEPPAELKKNFVYTEKEGFVHETMYEFTETTIEDLFEQHQHMPIYIPDKEELLLHSDPYYIDKNEYYKKVHAYIKAEIFSDDSFRVQGLAEEIEGILAIGEKDLSWVIDEHFAKAGISFGYETQRERLLELVEEYRMNIRTWQNNGFTSNELKNLNNRKTENSGDNTGRNAPCHCGSGKKYKECCLKKDRLAQLNASIN